MHFRRSALLLSSVLITAAVFACSSDDSGASGGPIDPNAEGGPNSEGGPNAEGGGDGEGPIVKKEFPTATPSIGGYTLVDAFPGVVFDIPSAITWPKAGGDPFVFERTGQIRRIVAGARVDVLDISAKIHVAGEGGALGLVTHPKFGDGSGHDFAYVWYNACPDGQPNCADPYTQRLERYTWTGAAFDPASVLTMVEEREFEVIHNAAKMLFGPDGFLYFGNGDDNTLDNHQTVSNALFAGIFRIDVDNDPAKSHAVPAGHTTTHAAPFTRTGYSIPNDNPFVGKGGNTLEEFFALGFRNPFSFSFDKMTGDLWMGDVGDSFREEINLVKGGSNYGWPVMEGELVVQGGYTKTLLAGTTATPPNFSYSHWEMADISSVFGGNVYRGPSMPELSGKYIFSDWPSNRVWALDIKDPKAPVRTTLIDNQYKLQPLNYGEDNAGELYFVQYGGDYTNDPTNAGGHIKKLAKDTSAAALPKRLVETYLFDDVPSLKPAANLVPYEVSSPLWSDGAAKKRWIRLPQGQKATYNTDGSLSFPIGTVFVKQFDLPDSIVPVGRTKHLETRVMIVGDTTTWGYTFRWNAAGTDAVLVSEPADETITDMTTGSTRNWQFPGFGQCWGCHRDDANTDSLYRKDKYRILGFTAAQLGVMQNGVDQRTNLANQGVFDPADVAKMPPVLPSPSDTTQTAETRAYAYLASNCSPCHHEGASYTGGGQTWIATYGAGNIAARNLDQETKNYPMSLRLANETGLDLADGNLVVPGHPEKSILLQRIKSNSPDLRMPPIARNVVDDNGAAIIEAWIQGM